MKMTPLHVNLNVPGQATSAVVSLDGDECETELGGFRIYLRYEPHGYRVDADAHQMLTIRIEPVS